MLGLALALCVNLVAIGYVVINGDQREEVAIRLENTNQTSTQDSIIIRFNLPMVQSTVASAVQITPNHPHQLVWTNDSQQMSLVPETPWPDDATVNIAITTNAQSQSGQRVRTTWKAQVAPQRVVQIRQVLPAPNQVDIARDDMIVVRFSQQMVTQSAVGRIVAQPLLQILPPVYGDTKWLDTRTLAFQADELAPNQEYTVTVPAQLSDVQGAPLQSGYTWRFRTIATRIEASFPANQSQEVTMQQSVSLTMTGQIDTVRLERTLTISPTVASQLLVTPLENNYARIDIVPRDGWMSDTQYYLSIGGGDSTLAPFETTFRTAPSLQLVARTPGDGESVGSDREVRFIFNSLLDTTTITEAITITPAPIQPARITTTGRDIRIAANWEVQVNPLIQISSALRNTNGISLTTPISSELRIDQRQALVTLPGIPGEIHDASQSNTFQLQIIPNRTATLRIYDLPVATLVRILDMDVPTLLNIDPARYNLPLLAQQELQSSDGNQRITVDIMQKIQGVIQSRIWLVQLISANGSQDVRLIRTRPATLHAVTLPQHIIVGIQEEQLPQPERPILLFQSGQLINQGKSDERGIWRTPLYAAGQQFVVVDPQQPIDAHKLLPLPPTPSGALKIVVDRPYTERGSPVNALISLPPRDAVTIAALRVRSQDGELINEQQIVIDEGVRTTNSTIRIARQLAPGLYVIEIALDNEIAQTTIFVFAQRNTTAQITQTTTSDQHTLTIRDQNDTELENHTVLWQNSTTHGMAMTDASGVVRVPYDGHTTVLMVHTDQGSILHSIPAQPSTPQLSITGTRNWVTQDQPITMTIRVADDVLPRENRIIQITARNQDGLNAPRQQVITNADGVAEVPITLPRGAWQISAKLDELTATTQLWVGETRSANTFDDETTTLSIGQTPRWMHNQSRNEQLLVAHTLNQQLQVSWRNTDAEGIVQSDVITQTGTLHSVISQAGKGYYHSHQQIVDPNCPSAIPIRVDADNQLMKITLQYLPNSQIVLNAYDQTHELLLFENSAQTSDDQGVFVLQLPDNGTTEAIHLSAIVQRDTCVHAIAQTVPVRRAQSITLHAPNVVRIGDVVAVTMFIRDALPTQTSRYRVVPEGLQIIDTLPQYSVTSNLQGNASVVWRYRVTAERVQLTIESVQSPTVVWQPTVIAPFTAYSNDGFVLRGTTSLEKGNDAPILLDMIATPQQLQQALMKTPYDQSNPSQIAHRLWHSISPTDQLLLLQQLTQLKLTNGAWGWVGSKFADPLITADVIIALTHAQQPMQTHQSAVRYLQQQLPNPQLQPSTRAIIGYALALQGKLPADELLALSRAPQLLGNEGLAALLLSIPNDYAYTIPSVLAELLQRVQSAPRGLWWAGDDATESLHNRENVNALIYQALSHLNVAPEMRAQLGTQLLSMRGVNGWSDSISNARIWSQNTVLLPALSATTTIQIRNERGRVVHSGMMTPAQPVRQQSQIQTNDDVLVGIARPRNQPAPTGEAAIWLQMYRSDGSLVQDGETFLVGDEITVNVSIAFFSAIPHVTIVDPQSALSSVVGQPHSTAPTSTRLSPDALILHATVETPQVLHYRYRIRMEYVGQSILEPIEIRDGSGTLHAQSNAVMVYVVTP
jgi:hypothetical protein